MLENKKHLKLTKTIVKLRSAIRQTIKNANITSQDTIILAVSGGADSMALALSAKHVTEKMHINTVTVTVDHSIRKNSRLEAEKVSKQLQKIGYKTHVVTISIDNDDNKGPEANARIKRYEAIYEISKQYESIKNIEKTPNGKCYIFTAHTMNDQAETVLLRLARGSSVKSLSSIHPQGKIFNLNVVRPFLEITRNETEKCCEDYGIDYVIDETNYLNSSWKTANGNTLLRVAIRHKIIPLLSKSLQQNVITSLARTAKLAQKDSQALEFIYQMYFEKLCFKNYDSKLNNSNDNDIKEKTIFIPKNELKLLPESIRKGIILKALKKNSYPANDITSKILDSIDNLLNADTNKYIEIKGANKIENLKNYIKVPFYSPIK